MTFILLSKIRIADHRYLYQQWTMQALIAADGSVTDFVEARMYKYYKYSLNYDPDISEVLVILNTLHGDADIYTSQI